MKFMASSKMYDTDVLLSITSDVDCDNELYWLEGLYEPDVMSVP